MLVFIASNWGKYWKIFNMAKVFLVPTTAQQNIDVAVTFYTRPKLMFALSFCAVEIVRILSTSEVPTFELHSISTFKERLI